MPDDRLAEIEARWAAAVSTTYFWGSRENTDLQGDADDDIAWLIDEVKRLRKHEPPKSKED